MAGDLTVTNSEPLPPSGGGLTVTSSEPLPSASNAPTAEPSPVDTDPMFAMHRLVRGAAGYLGKAFAEQAPVGEEVPVLGTMGAGISKGAAKTLIGLNKILGGTGEGVTPEQLETHGFWEGTGDLFETIAEFMGPEALEGLTTSQRLVKASKFMKMMEEFPLLGKALQKYPSLSRAASFLPTAARQGATAGAQTYVKTGGDLSAATKAAALTAGLGVTIPGVTEGLAGQVEQRAATQEMVGGVPVPITGEMRQRTPTPEQAAGQQAITNVAKQTLAERLQEVNESRAVPPLEHPALPTRTGPYQFEVPGVPPTETTTGEAVVEPRKKQIGTTVELREPPGGPFKGPRKVPEFQYLTGVKPGVETEAVTTGGGGTLRTEDPNLVREHIGRLNDIVDSEEFGDMPKDQQQQILDARAEAQRQMAEYHKQQEPLQPRYGRPNFEQIDIPAMVEQTGSISETARHIMDTATEGYNSISDALALNDISGGKFNAIKNANKEAWAEYNAAVGEDALNAANNKLDRTSQQMSDLLEKDIGGAVTPKELAGFDEAWRAGQMLTHVGKAVDGAFSGNASKYARSWEYRGFDGNTLVRNLDRLIMRYGRDTVERYVGEPQLNTLYRAGELNRTNAQRAKFGMATSNVSDWLQANYPKLLRTLSLRGALGAAGAHYGGGWVGGTAAVATYDVATALSKWTMNKILSNPRAADYLEMALRKSVSPQIYAPIIGNLMVRSSTQ